MLNPKLLPWLKAGINRFAEQGIEGLNVNELSTEIGISKTSYYHFFGSKQEYLKELFDYWVHVGTVQKAKLGLLKEDTKEATKTLNRVIVFDNYINEKFLAQLIASQKNIPIANEYIEEVRTFRIGTMEGLYARLGIPPNEAHERAKGIYIYYLGMTQYYFGEEPSEKEKENIYKNVLEVYWPEVLEMN